jgi:hypothetical protein
MTKRQREVVLMAKVMLPRESEEETEAESED